MKEVKNIPELRFPDFTDKWLPQLLEDIAIRGSGHTPNKSNPEYYNGNIPWVSLADSKSLDNGYVENTTITISQEGIDNSSAVLHPVESVLLSRDAGVGKSAVMKREMAVSQHFIVWRGKKEKLNNWFLYYKLQILKPEFERIAVGNTIKTIGLPYFKKLKINVPHFVEQSKIANFLTTVDKRINLLTQKKEKLEQYKKGVMQQIFNQQIRFKDDSGNDFPEWEEKRLGEVYEIVGGGTPETSKEKYWNGDIQWFTPTEIKTKYVTKSNRKINQEGLKKSSAKLLPIGTLLFTSRATIGDVGICLKECCTNQGFQSFIPNENNEIEFLYYWIIKNKKQFIRRSSGSTFLEISKKEIQKIKLFVPSFKEQQKIASFLSVLDNKIDLINQQIEHTTSWKKGLLQKMFV